MAAIASPAALAVGRPEAELLLLCARTSENPENANRIAALLREEMDWEYLLRMASVHGMRSLLYWHLSGTYREIVPSEILAELQDHFYANSWRSLFLTGELLKILRLFEVQGVTVVPYKGPVLATLAYGNVALREFADLDIVVREQDVPKARDLLSSLGYRQQEQLAAAQEAVFLKSHCEYVFINDDGTVVELHWAIMPRNLSFPLDLEDLWGRLEHVPLGGSTVPVFSPEDTLLILLAHGAKHRWERLGWICDVAELLRTYRRDIRWERITAQARAVGGERMLLLGIFLANHLLGADLPDEVLRRARSDRTVSALADEITRRLFGELGGSTGLLEESSLKPLYLKMRERLSDKVRYLLRTATVRSVEDYKLASLPRFLLPVYWGFRLARLTGKYGRILLERIL